MDDAFDIRRPDISAEEREFDLAIRPGTFTEFKGQERLVNNLKIFVEAARQRDEPLDHVLLSGPPGLGKTSLANIIKNEMGSDIKVSSGPVIEKPGDLAGLLTGLEEKDILFIDEIHRLSPVVEEFLYSAMEDYKIDILIDKGPNSRSIQLSLNRFTLIGATTRAGLLTSPLRSRFGIKFHLDYYDAEILSLIANRSSQILKIPITKDASYEISKRSRGTPRIVNALLRRVRDFAQIKGDGTINKEIAKYALNEMNIDDRGLDEMDNKILKVIIDKFNGGPVGLNTIGTAISEDPGTIEDVYEPFLIKEGFMKRTPRGREVTDLAYKHLNKTHLGRDQRLFD